MKFLRSPRFQAGASLIVVGLIVYLIMQLRQPPMLLDHASFAVKHFKKSVRFYDETLGALGFEQVGYTRKQSASYGAPGTRRPFFTIVKAGAKDDEIGKARGFHLAFKAPSLQAVNAWYQKALKLGAKDNGAPGFRPQYHQGYYAAFVIDPNGWHIEAVYHEKRIP